MQVTIIIVFVFVYSTVFVFVFDPNNCRVFWQCRWPFSVLDKDPNEVKVLEIFVEKGINSEIKAEKEQ